MASSSPIFIVGAPRSGTTLTARILNGNSKIFMPGETHYYDDIYSRFHTKKELSFTDRADIADRLFTLYGRFNEPADQARVNDLFTKESIESKLTDSFVDLRSLFVWFMEIQMRHENKCRWGNNVPRDLFNLHIIFDMFPDAKVIACIRDPRAFLVSYMKKSSATSVDQAKRIGALYHPVLTSLLWKANCAEIERSLSVYGLEKVYLQKYECLVSEPEKTVRELCDFIGAEFESDMLNVHHSNSSHGRPNKGIYVSSVDKWKTCDAGEDLYICQQLLEERMQAMGYSKEALKINFVRLAYSYLTFPFAALRAIIANRSHQGPLIPYLMKRIASLR